METSNSQAGVYVVKAEQLRGFAEQVLTASNVFADDAKIVAEGLIWSDLRGRHPQGVSRIPNFAQRVQRRLINSPATLRWIHSANAVELLDADNALGHVAGVAAMKRAVELAKAHGVGAVTVRQSNLFGAAAYFCSLATEENCIGFSCTNAVPKVAPYGGVRPVFGTNPLAFGCPTSSGVPVLVDLSTSAIAGSSARSIDETGKKLPEGVALDKTGTPTTDPKDLAEGTLLPAAGPKGFALALMVEVLCGVLSGAAMSKEIGSMYNTWDRHVNTGHFFFVIDIEKFLPVKEFLDRIGTLLSWVKSSAREGDRVRFPGEIRGELAGKYLRGGIPLPEETTKPLTKLAQLLQIQTPW